MKHTYKFIIAAIMAVALTACTANTDTAEETSQLTESTSAVAEAETSADEETTTTTESDTEAESEEITAAEEDVPAVLQIDNDVSEKYDLSSAVDISEAGYESNIAFGDALTENTVYQLWQSDDEDVSVYGVKTDTADLVLISHDWVLEEYERSWYGVYSSLLTIQQGDGELFTSLYSEGGSFESVYEMTLFRQGESGSYEMFTPDTEKLLAEIENAVSIEYDDENQTATFTAGDSVYEVSTEGYTNRTADGEIFFCSGNRNRTYSYDNGAIYCTVPYSYMMTDIAYVNAYLTLDNGELSVDHVELQQNN